VNFAATARRSKKNLPAAKKNLRRRSAPLCVALPWEECHVMLRREISPVDHKRQGHKVMLEIPLETAILLRDPAEVTEETVT
jgi:hypothetical protein